MPEIRALLTGWADSFLRTANALNSPAREAVVRYLKIARFVTVYLFDARSAFGADHRYGRHRTAFHANGVALVY